MLVLAGLWAAGAVQAADAWRTRVAPALLQAYDALTAQAGAVSGTARAGAPGHGGTAGAFTAPRIDAAGRIQVDVYYDCRLRQPPAAVVAGLAAASALKIPPLCVVEGWAPPAALPQLAAVVGVVRVRVPAYVLHRPVRAQVRAAPAATGIDGNGIAIMRADQFVTRTGTRGAGVTVGVQSAGVASLQTIIARGELPSGVQVILPDSGTTQPYQDEGTALLEEIHAVAPGAGLAFCGPDTFVDYVSCLGKLIAAGATILADDVSIAADDLMSAGTQAQAIDQAIADASAAKSLDGYVAAFSSAGNAGGSYWEGQYTPVSVAAAGVPALGCTPGVQADQYVAGFGGGANPYALTLTTNSDGSFPLLFAWSDPSGQGASAFDVFWFSGGLQLGCFSTAGTMDNEIVHELNLPGGTYTLYVATADASAAGKVLKIWAGGDGLTTLAPATAGGFVTPQSFAAGVITVGAVNGSDGVGDTIESFSSQGPISVQFPAPAQLQAPDLVAPDGIRVDAGGTYFESLLFPDGNFYGTSAAAPNAAAVAALLRADFPSLNAQQLRAALEDGAAPLGAGIPNSTFGHGRVDAQSALATLPPPTITPLQDAAVTGSAASAPIAFTVSGTGPLHFSVTSSNPALVPATLNAGGSPGATVSPADCGTTTLDCMLTVTPALGQAGTAVVTLAALDGANRPASTSMTLTSTDPAAAPAGPGGGGGGGTLDARTLMLLALLAAWHSSRGGRHRGMQRRPRGADLRP